MGTCCCGKIKPVNPAKKYITKSTESKYDEGDHLFIGYSDGCLLKFSIVEKKTIHDFGQIFENCIVSMVKTFDNKLQFICDNDGGFKQLDIITNKEVNSFQVKSARKCVLTCDEKFLITAEDKENCDLVKWSMRNKKQLHTWKSDVDEYVGSQTCSQDNKYQFIGYYQWLGIFDLQKNQTLKNIQTMDGDIGSVAFSYDNQSAFISDDQGNIKMINWEAGANSGDDFDLTQDSKKIGNYCTGSICLTKDDKYLFVGSDESVSVFETTTKEVIKEFELPAIVRGVNLIKNNNKVIIAEENGDLSIIDLETLEISLINENVTNDKTLMTITVI